MLRVATSQISLHKPLWARRNDSKKRKRQTSPCMHIPGSKEPCEAPSLETRLFPILSGETGSSLLSSEEHDHLSCLLRSQDTMVQSFLGVAVRIPKPNSPAASDPDPSSPLTEHSRGQSNRCG